MNELKTDILIVGGSVGGCAAALSALSMGHSIILTEETDWLGGQLTSQAVPPDEHPWIEQYGCTRNYRKFREMVRKFYFDNYALNSIAKKNHQFNPGGGGVSRICHEPRVALTVIEQMLLPYSSSGQLKLLLRYKPVAAETDGDKIKAVTLKDLRTNLKITVNALYVIDATELGDLLPLANVEYITGAESRNDTGELHAVDGPPQPDNVQAITWCFPMAFDSSKDVNHTIDKPPQYDYWRDYIPEVLPSWSGRLLDWNATNPRTLQSRPYVLMPDGVETEQFNLWLYRRIICRDHYLPEHKPHEVTLVNWPQNDYIGGNIIDKSDDEIAKYLEQARNLSLSLFYWLQTEAPHPNGGCGYPSLYLRPDLVGTNDGLAKYPYIRESRRIKAVFTVTESHIGTQMLHEFNKTNDNIGAESFYDSVGIGAYRIDLHPSTGGNNYIDISTLPFQIPLGSLIPIRVENLLPACKNIGVTHITNGCYRVHPVEWNIGESTGLLAAFCLREKICPRAVREKRKLLLNFQKLLENYGIELEWPQNIHPL